jgi:hypothetical protein
MIKHFDDLSFTVKAFPESHYVRFEIYEITGWPEGDTPERYYGEQVTADLEEAPLFAHGTVKWDGCSDWHIDEVGGSIHYCTRGGLSDLGNVLTSCWDWAAELIESWDGE